MGGFRNDNILGHMTPVTVPEDPEATPVSFYGNYLDAVREQEEELYSLQESFFAILLDDDRILKAARRWEECCAVLAEYAGSLFNKDKNNTDEREYAQKLFDLVTKAAELRRANISKHRRLMLAKKDLSETQEDRLRRAKYAADCALIRAVNTQARIP